MSKHTYHTLAFYVFGCVCHCVYKLTYLVALVCIDLCNVERSTLITVYINPFIFLVYSQRHSPHLYIHTLTHTHVNLKRVISSILCKYASELEIKYITVQMYIQICFRLYLDINHCIKIVYVVKYIQMLPCELCA